MAECIKREDALEFPFANGIYDHEHANEHFIAGCESYREWIASIPAADVRPLVKARWIGYPECLKYTNAYSDDHIVCSACEECFSILDNDCERFNFCPNCGAQMEG